MVGRFSILNLIPALKAADYTTLFRRFQHLDLSLPVVPELLAEDIIVAADSTGIKVTNRGSAAVGSSCMS